ncbi:cytidylyltransferase domain-containing protein [Clostridium botulinum]|uniref:acylneuraminate cytidylyltransferase family protein n=1 Tax=Clostridium botulinum TaxID=1491 RepID=UPI000773F70F|nr:acylneuraminate cytidylyltransferase family protein [Clostridium botulinum]MBY6811903.1 acylneuraminate cytidylyltransferase family protein [Clostridium botulinum]MBY6825385.1 acylneuraminate cytidylyltransferase family protein [Clostridium botulinum]MBY6835722.1 acylneuraminate cytidylyltransferase family protein [Clostridium botulinum]MBY6974419.1 acylneuraminate cytidylyltransferase family protein [Clostridium botulinum]MCS6105478.1 acylneuraminate cytidylyltransferase family protein [Cl
MKNEILAIIPARGGSKGLPGKNILNLNGKPLIAHTILASKNSKFVTRVVVSTDDKEIAKISKKYGAEVPYLRPSSLAKDKSLTIDSVFHMLDYLEKYECYFPEYVLLLQCTSPLRNEQHIDEAIEKLVKSNFHGIISICESEVNPYWTNILKNENLQYFLEEGKNITRRQDLPNIYRYNGAIYLAKTEVLKRERTFEVENLTGYVMDRESSIDIDTEIDFKIAEIIMKNKDVSHD